MSRSGSASSAGSSAAAALVSRLPLYCSSRATLPFIDNTNTWASKVANAEQFVYDWTTNRTYFFYTGTATAGNGGAVTVCYAYCSGKTPSANKADWTDLGPVTGVTSGYDAPAVIKDGANWYIFASGATVGSVVHCFRSTTGIQGTYSDQGASLAVGTVAVASFPVAPSGLTPSTTGGTLASGTYTYGLTALTAAGETTLSTTANATVVGPTGSVAMTIPTTTTGETAGINVYRNGQYLATVAHSTGSFTDTGAATTAQTPPVQDTSGSFDYNRVCECYVFRLVPDPITGATPFGAKFGMAYMGFPSNNLREQTGLATANALTGPWTKRNPGPSNSQPLIPVTAYFDEYENTADPFVVYDNGLYYFFYSAVPTGGLSGAGTSRSTLALATTPDLVNFTRRGIVLTPPALPAAGAAKLWRGSFFKGGDGRIYFPRSGTRYRNSNANQTVQCYLDTIDPQSFVRMPRANPWERIEAESADTRLSHTGTGWASTASSYNSPATAVTNSGGNYNTTVVGDRLILECDMEAVRVVVNSHINAGLVDIYLDGVKVITGRDAWSNDAVNPTLTTLIDEYDTVLAPLLAGGGSHKLELVNAGASPSGGSGVLLVDYFEILRPLGT